MSPHSEAVDRDDFVLLRAEFACSARSILNLANCG